MKKTYTRKQIQEAITHWQKVLENMEKSNLNEASYGGEHGFSDSSFEPPSQEQVVKYLVDADDEEVANMFLSVTNNLEHDGKDAYKKLLMNLEDPAMLADFLRTLIGSMSKDQFVVNVQSLYR